MEHSKILSIPIKNRKKTINEDNKKYHSVSNKKVSKCSKSPVRSKPTKRSKTRKHVFNKSVLAKGNKKKQCMDEPIQECKKSFQRSRRRSRRRSCRRSCKKINLITKLKRFNSEGSLNTNSLKSILKSDKSVNKNLRVRFARGPPRFAK